MHHPTGDVERLYVPKREGGRGLMQLEMNFKTTTIGVHKYSSTTNDWMLQLVLFYEYSFTILEEKHSISKQSNKFKHQLNLQGQTNETATCTLQARKIKRKAKRKRLKQIKET